MSCEKEANPFEGLNVIWDYFHSVQQKKMNTLEKKYQVYTSQLKELEIEHRKLITRNQNVMATIQSNSFIDRQNGNISFLKSVTVKSKAKIEKLGISIFDKKKLYRSIRQEYETRKKEFHLLRKDFASLQFQQSNHKSILNETTMFSSLSIGTSNGKDLMLKSRRYSMVHLNVINRKKSEGSELEPLGTINQVESRRGKSQIAFNSRKQRNKSSTKRKMSMNQIHNGKINQKLQESSQKRFKRSSSQSELKVSKSIDDRDHSRNIPNIQQERDMFRSLSSEEVLEIILNSKKTKQISSLLNLQKSALEGKSELSRNQKIKSVNYRKRVLKL